MLILNAPNAINISLSSYKLKSLLRVNVDKLFMKPSTATKFPISLQGGGFLKDFKNPTIGISLKLLLTIYVFAFIKKESIKMFAFFFWLLANNL